MCLTADATHKPPGGSQDAIRDAQGQHRKPPRRRPIDDSGAVLRIELRSVTRAEQRFGLGLPHRHGASLMRADCRVRHNPVGRRFAGFRAELGGVKPDEDYLIEERSVPDDLRLRFHWVRQLLRAPERKILGLDGLSSSVTGCEHEPITGLRARGFWILGGGGRTPAKGETEAQCGLQQSPTMSKQRPGGWRNVVAV
jgi:hypothetical protein